MTEGSEFEPQWCQEFSLNHIIYTGSRAHPISNPMCTEDPFQGVKRPEREAGHSPPNSAYVKKMWIDTSTVPYVFMAWNLVNHNYCFNFTSSRW
jgi:hypothetical protein